MRSLVRLAPIFQIVLGRDAQLGHRAPSAVPKTARKIPGACGGGQDRRPGPERCRIWMSRASPNVSAFAGPRHALRKGCAEEDALIASTRRSGRHIWQRRAYRPWRHRRADEAGDGTDAAKVQQASDGLGLVGRVDWPVDQSTRPQSRSIERSGKREAELSRARDCHHPSSEIRSADDVAARGKPPAATSTAHLPPGNFIAKPDVGRSAVRQSKFSRSKSPRRARPLRCEGRQFGRKSKRRPRQYIGRLWSSSTPSTSLPTRQCGGMDSFRRHPAG